MLKGDRNAASSYKKDVRMTRDDKGRGTFLDPQGSALLWSRLTVLSGNRRTRPSELLREGMDALSRVTIGKVAWAGTMAPDSG